MTETFHARFPVSVKPLVTSALGRRSVGLRLTLKHQPARDKKNSGSQDTEKDKQLTTSFMSNHGHITLSQKLQ